MPPLPPHLRGNQGARLLVSLPAWGTGRRVRWGYTSPSAWGTKGLGPLVPLPAWGTHLHGALGGWGHPCPCLHRGLGGSGSCVSSPAGCDGAVRIPACEGAEPQDRAGWDYARPCLHGHRTPQGQAGTPYVPQGEGVPAVHCGGHWSIWPQGCPQVGKLETSPVPVCMVSTACARVWDFLDGIQGWGDAACSETPGLAGRWAKVAVSQSVPPALRRARNKL